MTKLEIENPFSMDVTTETFAPDSHTVIDGETGVSVTLPELQIVVKLGQGSDVVVHNVSLIDVTIKGTVRRPADAELGKSLE